MEKKENLTDSPNATTERSIEFRRSEDITSGYANNFQLEPNPFDLKIIFGTLNYSESQKVIIDQFSSVNISWSEIKLLIYFLRIHLVQYEANNGKVKIHDAVMPEEPSDISPEFDNAIGREILNSIKKFRKELMD
jgi:hypothetical protein